jgi:hypothetical protein
MSLATSPLIVNFNKFLALIGATPAQEQIDAWLVNFIATFVKNLPAVPANVAPLIPLYVYSLYVDAGLPVPADVAAAAGVVVPTASTSTSSSAQASGASSAA